MEMLIVDAQVHVWGADKPERPWPLPHGTPHRPVPFAPQDLLSEMDTAGVSRAVLVPPTWEGYRNDIALEAVQQNPDRFAIMGRFDAGLPDAHARLAAWRNQPGMLGIRLARDQQVSVDGPLAWLCAEAEAHGVPLMLNVTPSQLSNVDEIAQRHPQLRMVIDHLAVPKGSKDDAAFAELDKLLALARYPSVAVKATSLPSYTADTFPFRRLHPYLRRVYDAFGPQRMFWGSDLTKMPCPYSQAVAMFTEGIPWLTTEDREWIMGRAVCEWLRWQLPIR